MAFSTSHTIRYESCIQGFHHASNAYINLSVMRIQRESIYSTACNWSNLTAEEYVVAGRSVLSKSLIIAVEFPAVHIFSHIRGIHTPQKKKTDDLFAAWNWSKLTGREICSCRQMGSEQKS